jgi:SPP1 gp7 family putative phage head morphogenesis protein
MSNEAVVRALMAVARAKVVGAGQGLRDELRKFDASRPLADQSVALHVLTSWFASRDAIAATELPDDVLDVLLSAGVDRLAAIEIGKLLLAKPLSGRSRYGAPSPFDGMPAIRRVASEEPEYRAAYLLAAARRLTLAKTERDYASALDKERRYLDMHVGAGRGRRAAARKVDEVSEADGPLLVWRTQNDNRVDSRCAMLEGRLFTAADPPDGVYPGAVHPRCRCFAVGWGGQLFT